jgi:hypothetical protein
MLLTDRGGGVMVLINKCTCVCRERGKVAAIVLAGILNCSEQQLVTGLQAMRRFCAARAWIQLEPKRYLSKLLVFWITRPNSPRSS